MLLHPNRSFISIAFAIAAWIVLFEHSESREIRVISDKDTSTCLYCTASEGICSKTCAGRYCVKAVDLTSGRERRYCMKLLEPEQPKPNECMVFTTSVGLSEKICVCTGNYCNASPSTGAHALPLVSALVVLGWFAALAA
ncbi:hypothetical protein M3Y99_01142700 [Aphelenchoides fujianensis]|nr:hypothetical protein M3Y99_01142700 [Aphelenchoides fujianensis]